MGLISVKVAFCKGNFLQGFELPYLRRNFYFPACVFPKKLPPKGNLCIVIHPNGFALGRVVLPQRVMGEASVGEEFGILFPEHSIQKNILKISSGIKNGHDIYRVPHNAVDDSPWRDN